MKRKRTKSKEEIDHGNALAASIILEDPDRYGGEGALPVVWARLWIENHDSQMKWEWAPTQCVGALKA